MREVPSKRRGGVWAHSGGLQISSERWPFHPASSTSAQSLASSLSDGEPPSGPWVALYFSCPFQEAQ